MNITPAQLSAEFDRVVKIGWLPLFAAAAKQYNFSTSLLLAIASRETNLTSIKGDFRDGQYHGYGIMQIDIATDPAFCSTWNPTKLAESINEGALILSEKRAQLVAAGITDPHALAASYNAGATAVIRALAEGNSADSVTTGRDYGTDVIERATAFASQMTTT